MEEKDKEENQDIKEIISKCDDEEESAKEEGEFVDLNLLLASESHPNLSESWLHKIGMQGRVEYAFP